MKYKSRKRKFPKKINFFLYLVSLISRFFGKKRGAICFVTHPNKPWGCNLEALLCFAIKDDRVKKIYLLNFGDIPTETLCNEIADPQNKVSIIDPRDFLIRFAVLLLQVCFLSVTIQTIDCLVPS